MWKISKFEETDNLKDLCENEIDNAWFAHDAAYSDSEDLAKRTISNRILKDRAYKNFFLGRIYFKSNDVFQNLLVCQPTLDMLELKKYKDTDYFFSWKSNGIYHSKLNPLYTASSAA